MIGVPVGRVVVARPLDRCRARRAARSDTPAKVGVSAAISSMISRRVRVVHRVAHRRGERAGDLPVGHAGLRRHHRAHAVDAALGVGEGAVLLQERRAGQEHVREAWRSRSGTGPARRRSSIAASAGRDVLGVGVGLRDVLALDVEALEGAVERGVEHVRDAQARLGLERPTPQRPRTCARTASSETWR